MKGKLLLEATMFECRWPLDSKKAAQPRCCGKYSEKIIGYCKHHHKIAFQKSLPRRIPSQRISTEIPTFFSIQHKETINIDGVSI